MLRMSLSTSEMSTRRRVVSEPVLELLAHEGVCVLDAVYEARSSLNHALVDELAEGFVVDDVAVVEEHLVPNRLYMRWPVACSEPPTYRSTERQYSFASFDTRASGLCGSM